MEPEEGWGPVCPGPPHTGGSQFGPLPSPWLLQLAVAQPPPPDGQTEPQRALQQAGQSMHGALGFPVHLVPQGPLLPTWGSCACIESGGQRPLPGTLQAPGVPFPC